MINKKSFFMLIVLVMLLNLAVICANNTEDTISKEKIQDNTPQISQDNYEKDYTKTIGKENKTYTNSKINKEEQKSIKTAAGEENVNNYTGLVTAVNNAKTSTQQNYTINLQSGNYDATEAIRWNSTSNCKTLIINGNNNNLNGQGIIQFMQINSGTTVILNNIHLNNYYKNGNGGVIVNQGTLIIKNTSLTNSIATMAGGAIYNSEANLIIINSTLSNNNAIISGGAIYNYKGTINITGSKITESNVNDPTYGGGALYNRGTLTISNSSFTKNKIGNNANSNGGAIYNYKNSIVNITNTNFTNNEAKNGGAIYNDDGTLLIFNSELKYNNATENGGAINNQKGNINITQSNITNNNADWGGAIYGSTNSNPTIINSNLTNNNAKQGGAIHINTNSNLTIINSTLTHNNATNNGGAIQLNTNSNLTIINSTLTHNNAKQGGALYGLSNSTINIINSTLTHNNASSGGAIYNDHGNMNITQTNLTNNYAGIEGGAINKWYGNINIINSSLNKNNAKQGGAIVNNYGNTNIIQSNLTHNNATNSGGAIYTHQENIKISNSSLNNNNVETSSGGSIHIRFSTLTIENSTLENNTSPTHGGAIYNHNGILSLFNSTLNKNKAEWNGGVIYNYKVDTDIEFNVTGTNFTDNQAGSGAAIYSDNEGITNTIMGNTFTRNRATSNETLVINGIKTIKDNIYDSTDISFKTVKLTLEDEKTTYSSGEDIILNFTIELEHPEYYDLDILEKVDINKTIYINNIENETTTLNHYTLSDLEMGTYDVYFTFSNLKSNNVTFWIATDFETNVSNYKQLVEAIKNATSNVYYTYKINLLPGDFNATENITWSNSSTPKIIINGNSNILDGQNTYEFIEIAQGHNLTLENITLTNYTAQNGGVINNKGNLSIYNTTLNNNNITNNGGTINNEYGNINITQSYITHNQAIRGGAIYNLYGNINIIESNLTDNNATNSGGAIYNYGNINITQSNITYNTATRYGGALYSSYGNIQILNSSLNNNKAEINYGGSIYIIGSTVSITNSTLENNTSPEHGGAIYNYEGTLSIFNSAFNNNKAEGNGGAIYNYGRLNNFEFNVTDSNFTENQASSGAAICSDSDGISNTITGNTFTRNTANNNETLVVNGTKTISNNSYDSTDINIKVLNLTIEDEKTTYDPDEEVILNFTIELEHPEYYDSDILEKVDINKTIYINNIEKETTTLNHYTLSDLELGKYDVYFTSSNQKSNNVTFLVSIYEVNVSNYQQLVEAIKNATNEKYNSYKINLVTGDYNATESIKWENSLTRKIIINGNGNTLNGQGTYQFIQIAQEHNLTLENIIITNYTGPNGGAISNRGNITIRNTSLINNIATGDWGGGAIYSSGGNINISNSSLNNNKVEQSAGGAIYLFDSTVSITNSTLENNTSPTHGGAIYNNNGNVYLFNSSLNNNKAEWNGGAIYNYRRSDNIEINITSSNFTENQASSGATICSDNEGITNTITGNTFTRNTANNKETLVINGNKTINNNIYDSTDISFKTINLTLQDEKTTHKLGEDVILNFKIELEHPEYYDSDILEKVDINKKIYVNNIENDTTTNNSYILSNLERGEYNVYFTSFNLQSNEVTFQVRSDSTISTPEESYEYYDGVNNKIPLSINDPSEEKGVITTIVTDENGYRILSSYYNIGDSYELPTDTLIYGLKNIYTTLNDSYNITVTYTSNIDYINPSSTNFTLNIIKQRNTTIVHNILNNTECNVKINITVLDSVYNTPIPNAPIQITGDIIQNTTSGIIIDNTITPGEYTINIKYNETDEYKESTATINFTVEIDKDSKIAELEEQVENLSTKFEEAQQLIEKLNNNITNLTTQLEKAQQTIETLTQENNNLNNQLEQAKQQIENLTEQLTQAQQEIQTLYNNITNLTQEIEQKENQIENLTGQVEEATNKINNLTQQIEQANQQIENLTKEIEELTKPSKTTLTINPITDAQYEDTILITGELVDADGRTVPGTIELNINGKNITVKADKTGKYEYEYTITTMSDLNITAAYEGTEKFTPSNASTTITIEKQDTNIIFNDISDIKSGEKVNITGQLVDGNGNGFYGTVKLLINNGRATIKTDNEGKFSYETTLTKVGTNNISGKYIESTKYNTGNGSTTLTVTPLGTTIVFDELAESKSGDTVTITGKLLDENDNPLVGTIKLLINNGRATVKTDANGVFTYEYTFTKVGINNITAAYLGANRFSASNTTTTIMVGALSTKLTINHVTAKKGEKIIISGKLVDENDKPIVGTVKLLINNGRATVKTSTNGVFTYEYTFTKAGANNISATYNGANRYTVSTATSTVTVAKAGTKITLNSIDTVTQKTNVNITGQLSDEYGNGIYGTVKLLINNGRATVKTDNTGLFTYTHNATRAGENTIKANYLESNNYEACETITTFTVVKS